MKTITTMRASLILLILLFASFSVFDLQAQAPKKMSYQGKLTDSNGNPISNGTYNIKFSIYDAVNAGSSIWDETQGVSVQDGLFNVLLGDLNALNIPFTKQYWLGVKVDSDAEMTPRTALASTPYSLHAISIADNSVTNSKIVNNTIDPSKIKKGNDGQVFVTEGGSVGWENRAVVPQMFRWRTTADNVSTNLTFMDHPDLNNNPDALLVVTHKWRSQYSNAIGVWYSSGRNMWTIFNEDQSDFNINEDFIVIYTK